MRRKISCPWRTGAELEIDGCKSIEQSRIQRRFGRHTYKQAPVGSARAQPGMWVALSVRSSFNYFPRHNTSRVACVLRKCQGVRAMNRRIGSSFLRLHPYPPLLAHTRARRARVSTRLSFRGTEFIFPEEIRKGTVPSRRRHPRPPVLPLNCQPRKPRAPVIPRDSPRKRYIRNAWRRNQAEIYPRKERRTLMWYRRVNNLRSTMRATKRASRGISGRRARAHG